jgi:hypothetical protein
MGCGAKRFGPVIAAGQQTPNSQIFSTFTVAKPNCRYYYDFAVAGFSGEASGKRGTSLASNYEVQS